MTTVRVHVAGHCFETDHADWAGPAAPRVDWEALRAAFNAELARRAPAGVWWAWTPSGPYIYADVALEPCDVRAAWDAVRADIDLNTLAGGLALV